MREREVARALECLLHCCLFQVLSRNGVLSLESEVGVLACASSMFWLLFRLKEFSLSWTGLSLSLSCILRNNLFC